MPTKMRLQRFGKKRKPFYHIVIADGRAPRDGKFIEKIGTYNPVHNPAVIELDFDKAVQWLNNGAQPTDTVRAILSYKGVLYKHHLLRGVAKGALTEAEAEAKFQTWLTEKEAKIDAKRKGLEEKNRNERKEILDAETKVKEAREATLAKKRAAEIEAAKPAKPVEEAKEEVEETAETPAAETAPVAEKPAEEAPAAEESKKETEEK
ncbi:MAG: 30S ribosomal protein S16 [Bacteroidetes bacterium]|nr:MAG: 30S ribosomal protein S16 [Bacteroidota bacterium]